MALVNEEEYTQALQRRAKLLENNENEYADVLLREQCADDAVQRFMLDPDHSYRAPILHGLKQKIFADFRAQLDANPNQAKLVHVVFDRALKRNDRIARILQLGIFLHAIVLFPAFRNYLCPPPDDTPRDVCRVDRTAFAAWLPILELNMNQLHASINMDLALFTELSMASYFAFRPADVLLKVGRPAEERTRIASST